MIVRGSHQVKSGYQRGRIKVLTLGIWDHSSLDPDQQFSCRNRQLGCVLVELDSSLYWCLGSRFEREDSNTKVIGKKNVRG